MSGYDQIMDWFDDQGFDPEDYDSLGEYIVDLEKEFDTNGRGIPLAEIFDAFDYEKLEQKYNFAHENLFEPEEKNIDHDIDLDKALNEITKEIPKVVIDERIEKTLETNYTVKQIKDFFKRLFGL